MKFDLIDRNGRIVGQVDAATHGAARTSATARSLPGFYEALPHRDDWPAPRIVPRETSIAADSEARLVEAFGRLGYTRGETAQAARGRRRPWERVEETGRLTGVASRGSGGRDAAGAVDRRDPAARREEERRRRGADEFYGLSAQARAATAKSLVDAGYDRGYALQVAGLPPAPQTAERSSSRPAAIAAKPPVAVEAGRGSSPGAGDEVVQLRELQIGNALGRAFRLSESEASIAGHGR